ncbi:MAG: flagellar hook-basal body complex protein [Alphaproteobacteria bacterium]|nr:flagellar hook-basal body complex protein [Alphaproteobacteria bacterium]
MSLFGAMQSGISGLTAQSSAMAAISDNIVNVNTIGYKNTNVDFKTLVTKQTSSTNYSSGGVQGVTKQSVDMQGLLADNSSSTAVAISGSGYFVVNQTSSGTDGLWAYTRAGDFSTDENGYLKNTSGYYAQAWSLLPWDGNANASTVTLNGITYMKAYYDSNGNTVYVNDNVIDSKNLQAVNLSKIGGTADATQQLSIGANLPADDTSGTTRSISALIYDSLGNASNLSLNFQKEYGISWGLDVSVPNKATNVTVNTKDNKVFSSAGQMQFTDIPKNGSSIAITDDSTGTTYNFVFTNNPSSVTSPDIAVDLSSVLSVSDFTTAFGEAIQENVPSADRFAVDSNTISITQSVGGSKLTIDASKTLACVQSGAHPNLTTGIPSGIFTIDAIDQDLKNGAAINFTSTTTADYVGQSVVIDGKTYTFTNGTTAASPAITVDISASINGTNIDNTGVVETLVNVLNADGNQDEPGRFTASGLTLEINPTTTASDISIDFSGLGSAVSGSVRDAVAGWTTNLSAPRTIGTEFTYDTIAYKGDKIPAVTFNSDGTPKYYNVADVSIEWANGAKDMTGDTNQGTTISLSLGEAGTNTGLTCLSGTFDQNYIKQDGAKFGSYAGVSIDENGVVTAMFDNGELRPIAIIPLATFTNPNAMESLTGNVWLETEYSGEPLLKTAGQGGAGTITSNSLEQSTVDLATEFSNMIVTQRAYSAATKIITTSSDMLSELTNLIR